MIEELRAVLLFEYRRYMRARVFWARLLWNASIGAAAAIVFYLASDAFQGSLALAVLLFTAFVGLGVQMMFQILPMGSALFDDSYEGRALPDLWLTGMSPLSVAVGRWAFAGLYTLFTLLTLSPMIWLVARAAGVSVASLIATLLIFWLSLMRLAPELFSLKARECLAQLQGWREKTDLLASSSGTLLTMLLASSYLWLLFLGMSAPPAMPIFLFAPPLALLEAHRVVQMGGFEIPLSLLGMVFLLGFALLGLLSVLQAMDAPLRRAQWLQPLLGSGLLLALWGASLAVYATQGVQTPSQAQSIALHSLWLGWTLYAFFQSDLAFFTVWRGESISNLAQPARRGALWLSGLWMSMGVLAPFIIYAVSGQGVDASRWLAALLTLGAQCVWLSRLCYQDQPYQNDAYTRYAFTGRCHTIIATFVPVAVWGALLLRWLSSLVGLPWLQQGMELLAYLSPACWVFLPNAPLWVYGVYALYNLVLAWARRGIIVRVRRTG
ncbi:MAG: hypothetical protein NZM28_03265 [Fimbriimonadales bacterium]|nr:hypothetical protein [Fimbriimonadales bacterium]